MFRFLMIAAAGILMATPSLAQQAKVVKVQGRKAIVQFPEDSKPRVGQVLDLGGGSSHASASSGSGSRANIIGGSTEFSSLTVSGAASSTSRFSFDGRWGWNEGVMEYGPIGGITYSSTAGSTARLMEAGAFFDYNLVPNTAGTEIVYGGMALGKFGSYSATTGSTERTGTVITIEVGGQLKWYPLGTNVAVRFDALYRMENPSDSIKTSVLGPGFVTKAGFYIYY